VMLRQPHKHVTSSSHSYEDPTHMKRIKQMT
jgi:hypothetical protein